ncbi:lysophospholipid acyltransferase family protein [Luteococcus sp.]|uniref:lysophospholipid acyltransferase family protein n=1 Tax=Luteococcus sp. TaxID=1969402 RepID=UPI0037357851
MSIDEQSRDEAGTAPDMTGPTPGTEVGGGPASPPPEQPPAGPQLVARAAELTHQAAERVRVQVEGADLLPAEGPALLVLNHLSHLDQVPARPHGRRIHVVGPHRGTAARTLKRLARRSEPDQDPEELAHTRAKALLEQGELVAVFPEGGRSPDGRLYRGRPWVARLVLDTQVPVLPVAVLPQQSLVARTVAPHLRVGTPLDLERYRALPCPEGQEQLVCQMVTDLLMESLMALSGQTYMDIDVDRRRAGLLEQRRTRTAATRAEARARRARELAEQQQRIADREAEAAEIARAQALAADLARDQARRAAEADARRQALRQVRLDQGAQTKGRDITRPRHHSPTDGND